MLGRLKEFGIVVIALAVFFVPMVVAGNYGN